MSAPAPVARAGAEPAATRSDAAAKSGYAGLATRTVAFAIDAAIVNAVAWSVAAIVALGLSLLRVPHDVQVLLAAIGAGIGLLWAAGYFVFFWSADGRTPGDGVMRIRVENVHGRTISSRRAIVRVLLLPLSALPLCAGFVLILVDNRRRALHDRLARTVVVYAAAPEPRITRSRWGEPRP